MSYNIDTTYVYFSVTDYSNSPVLSSYTLDITPLTFVPNFNTSPLLSAVNSISNKNIKWDFGDGTFSTELRPQHVYKWPGQYTVSLTVFDTYGKAFDSQYSTTVYIYDYISTQIAFREYSGLIYDVPAGRLVSPLNVDVHTSWQNYQELSGAGVTINLYASGARGDYNYVPATLNDKWSHLRSLSRFYKQVQNDDMSTEYVEIDSLSATQTEIYVKLNSRTLQRCSSTDTGSVLAGVTGTCEFWYTDDKPGNLRTDNSPVILLATLDNTKFKDAFTQRIDAYGSINYPPAGFQNLNPAVFPVVKIRFNPADHLAITTTGIDANGADTATGFNIPEISWQQTEIPFVVTFKDSYGYTTKNYPPLSSSAAINTKISPTTYCDVQAGIVQLSGNNYIPVDGVEFYEDFNAQVPQSLGAFYKGYFIPSYSTENCLLTANVTVLEPAHYPKDALLGWIAMPQYNIAQRILRQEYYSGVDHSKIITFAEPGSQFPINNERNIYAITVAPSGAGGENDYQTWFADAVNDRILKFDLYGNQLTDTYYLSAMPTLTNNQVAPVDYRNSLSATEFVNSASPNCMALDGENNLWVTLLDSGTALKIDPARGVVVATAVPYNISNVAYTKSTDYLPHKGFVGEGLILPSSIDTDLENNVWITYNHPEYSALVKYRGTNNFTTAAEILTSVFFPSNFTPNEVCVDRNKNVWVTVVNYNNRGPVFEENNDYLYKFDSTGKIAPGFPLSGFNGIGNLIVDGNQNAWVSHHRETLSKIDNITNQRIDFKGGTGSNTSDYICSIGGLTCDTSNNLWVINNYDNTLYTINAAGGPTQQLAYLNKIDLTYPNTTLPVITSYNYFQLPGSNLSYPSALTNFATVDDPGFVYGFNVVLSAGKALDWTNHATRLYGSGYANFNQYNILTNEVYTPYTASVYVSPSATAANGILRVILACNNGDQAVANFNTTTNAVYTSTGGSGVSALTATVSYTNVGNWYRVSITGMFPVATPYFGLVLDSQSAPIDVQVWGGQIEKSNTMNNFVYTTTAAVLTSFTTPSLQTPIPVNEYSDGFQEFQAYGDWNGYRWINKYMVPVNTVRTITGCSNLFNIYPADGKYNVSKVNENWDAAGFYDSLRFQETLLDKQVFFDQFLGVIVGKSDAQPYELGKTIYEKVANFVENRADVDRVNLDALLSLCKELTVDFEKYNYLLPPQLKRLTDILSIKQSILWGTRNKYALNFDNRGTQFPNDTYGINLSSAIDVFTGTITSGVPIVAYETFSGIYKVVNTNYITDPGTVHPLSTYSLSWGWELTAPESTSGPAIGSYYQFFHYNPSYSDIFYNNIIDWENPLTTLTPENSAYDTWSNDNGIMQNMLSYEITKGFQLFTSAVKITYNS